MLDIFAGRLLLTLGATGMVVAIGVAGCASPSAAKNEPEPDAAPLGTTGFLARPPCTQCLETECPRQLSTCNADPSCRALRACRASCSDATCDHACLGKLSPDGGSRAYMDVLADCATNRCAVECPGRPAAPAEVRACIQAFDQGLPDLSTQCAAQRDCACQNCTAEWSACLDPKNPNCTKNLGCNLLRCKGEAACPPECLADAIGVYMCSAKFCGTCSGDGG